MKLSYTGQPLSKKHGMVFGVPAKGPRKLRFARGFSFPHNFDGNSLFVRNLVKPAQREGLLKEAKRLVPFFECSKMGASVSPNAPLPIERLLSDCFRFFYNGVPVVIKWTGPFHLHGGKPNLLRHDFLAHQRAVRAGQIDTSFYILRSPKVYGKVGDFLVMEYVSNAIKQEASLRESFTNARGQLERNLHFLEMENRLSFPLERPQSRHLMAAGVENGKWIFYLPYDYD